MKFPSWLCVAVLALSRLGSAAVPGSAVNSASTPDIVLASQLGPYPVSIYRHEVNTSRPDPLAPTPQLRRLMITIYRPFLDNFTCPLEYQLEIPYMPSVVANALFSVLPIDQSSTSISSLLASVKLLNCSRPLPSSTPSGPVILFSPGYGGTHDGYASILQSAASSGYTVVAIDHTYEAAAVVFSDGYVAYASNVTAAYDNSTGGQDFLQIVRINDTISVLDAIETGSVPGLGCYTSVSNHSNSSSSFGASLTPLRALMYGHSFGGSTAVNVASLDARVVAAANIDGPFYPPVANGTVSKPIFMMQSSALPPMAFNFPAFYSSHAYGWKTWVRPNNTVHYGYTDLPLLADLLGLRGTVIPLELIGTVNSRRLQEIVWTYITEFFASVLSDATSSLLEGPSKAFPDVDFVGHVEAATGH